MLSDKIIKSVKLDSQKRKSMAFYEEELLIAPINKVVPKLVTSTNTKVENKQGIRQKVFMIFIL